MKKSLIIAVLYAVPFVAFAQTPTNLIGLISFAGDVANRLIPLLIALALLAFFWGIVMYVWGHESEKGREVMIAGVIGLFVMVSIWGIIRIAQNTFGVGNAAPVGIPQVPQR